MKNNLLINKAVLVLLIFGLTNCKVTEEKVAGYYKSSSDKMLILKLDNTCKLEVGDVVDTVLTIFRGTLSTKGQWALNKNIVSLTINDPKYKSWESNFKVKGNKLICTQPSCLSYQKIPRPEDPISDFKIGSLPNKTLQDTIFKKKDIIRIPEVRYSLHYGIFENYDSLKIVANFLKSHPNLIVEISSHTDSRGYSEENLELTEKRAASVREFLIDKFTVNPDQIKCKGYGESQPIIPDTEIKKATSNQEKETLHQINRRTAMTVIYVK